MSKKISGMILRKDIEFYEQCGGLLSKGYLRQQKTIERADENLKLFTQGKLDVNPRDYPTFAKYINTFAEEDDKEKFFAHMKNVYGFDAQKSLEEQNESDWQYAKAKIIGMSPYDNNVKKSFGHAARFVKKVWNRSRAAVIGAVVLIGSAFGIKTDSHSSTLPLPTQDSVNAKKTSPKTAETGKTAAFKEVQDSIPAIKYQKIYQNFYNTKLEILTSATKKNQIYKKVEKQVEKGIFALPAHICKEKVAYIDAMYKEYGLKSPIENAINSKKKLTQAQQAQLIQELTVKDSDIKSKALSVHGKLTKYSAFDKAERKLQNKHIANLTQLRNIQQRTTAN